MVRKLLLWSIYQVRQKKSSILGWLKVLKLLKKIASYILKNQDSLDFLVSLHSLNILALKVQLFSEGHKNWANLPLFIRHYLVASNYKWIMGQSFVAFTEYLNFENKINIFLFFSNRPSSGSKVGLHWLHARWQNDHEVLRHIKLKKGLPGAGR